jgi:nitroimidazol reductase NimA-like FMN-containing flavoprotein (pyridoxamine 5'-phosphate oxidase superfamily)
MEESELRRKDREILDVNEKLAILKECKVCRLALSVDDKPYVVPKNFGFSFENDKLTLYFHGAKEGKTQDMIHQNNEASFEVDCGHKLISGDAPDDYSYAYRSIIGFGKITLLESEAEKTMGLNQMMKHQTGKDLKYTYKSELLNKTAVYKMEVEEFTAKKNPG